MNSTLSAKRIITGAIIISGMLFFSGQASAQVIGQSTTTSSPTYSSSVRGDFQDAGFQQSGSSAATTGGGVTDTLKQPGTGGTLTVSGGAPNQTVDQPKSSKTPLFMFITIAAVTGLALIVIYLAKTTKKQAANEQNFTQEVILEAKTTAAPKKAESIPAAEPVEPEATEQPKPKKAKKPKKKSKKHHR